MRSYDIVIRNGPVGDDVARSGYSGFRFDGLPEGET